MTKEGKKKRKREREGEGERGGEREGEGEYKKIWHVIFPYFYFFDLKKGEFLNAWYALWNVGNVGGPPLW